MQSLRRLLGVFVMIAGVLGLALSLIGLVGTWVIKPSVTGYVNATIVTLDTSIKTSQKAMQVTAQALGGTVASVEALSSMLSTTAQSVEDSKPVLEQVISMLGETMPATLESATASLKTAQQAADVLDSAIKSLENFRTVLSAAPLLGALVEMPEKAYDPKVPLAQSLGDLATNLEGLPETFSDISANLEKADENMATIQSNLTTMSDSVSLISQSLSEYEAMVGQSQSSLDSLKSILTDTQNNLDRTLNGVAILFSLFFLWFLAAQVVIFSQGWELYHGTADRMENKVE